MILAIFAVSLLILFIVLQFFSHEKPKPYVDGKGEPIAGSISEKTFITIGGIRQGMFIKSKNQSNPVLLCLHGGLPEYFLSSEYPTGLEDYFTVVYWEQRGAGLSYNASIPRESMNLDQLISDTEEVSNYLRNRFGKEKIYLMGRSGGSFIGIQAAEKSPHLYHAYIGIGQMTDQKKSERMAYEYLLKTYREAGNRKMVRKLEAFPVTDVVPDGYLKLRDQAMHNVGIGTTRDMKSVIFGMFFPSLVFEEYTLMEKINLWRGKAKSGVHPLWNVMLSTDLSQQVNKLKIPVYFFHGVSDYTVSYPLAKKYIDVIQAPVKGFYTFYNSAHSPHFEEPMRVKEIFKNDVLNGLNLLSDKN